MMKTKIRSYLLIADLSNIIMVCAFNLSVLMLIKMVQRSDIKLAEVAGVLFVILFWILFVDEEPKFLSL